MNSKMLITKSSIFLMLVIFYLFSPPNSFAQPTNYCSPLCPEGYTSCTCWNSMAKFVNVKVTNKETNEVLLERNSDEDNCYFFDRENEILMHPGESYMLHIRRYNLDWINNADVYIDWNMDGDFYDSDIGQTPTVNEYYWNSQVEGFSTYMEDDIEIKVPETQEDGKTRMRLITSHLLNDGPCCVGSCSFDTFSNAWTNEAAGEAEDYVIRFEGGVKSTYPGEGDVLYANELYNDETRPKNGEDTFFRKPGFIFSANQPEGIKANFKIMGPLPANTLVYEGLDRRSGSPDIDISNRGLSMSMEAARGSFARNDNGDFISNRGGTYKAYAHQLGKPREVINRFTVSWDNDIASSEIISPKTNIAPKYFKYMRMQTVKVTGLFTNVGINDVTSFDAFAYIYNSEGDLVYRDSVRYSTPIKPVMHHNDKAEIDFTNVKLRDVGIYKVIMECDLINANDQDDYNDHLARQGDVNYTVEVAYEIQVASNHIIKPAQGETIICNRPITPMAEFLNLGIGDASDVPACMWVKKLPNGPREYVSNIIIQDIQSGKYNSKTEKFEMMTIKEPGDYQVCISLSASEDPVRTDDTLCQTFHVDPGLQGVYTIGNLNLGKKTNFPSIDSAMNALYYQGITGPLTFELTDPSYDVWSPSMTTSAWDLSSNIIGLGYNPETQRTNTLTWRPAPNMAPNYAGITITLHAGNGKGIQFGQALVNNNKYAIVNKYKNGTNAKSPGYIIFDGGAQKAMNFVLNSGSEVFGSVFYLGMGSHDITVKNCIIQNGLPETMKNVWVPLARINGNGNFEFDADSSGNGDGKEGYTAGISIRGVLLSLENMNFLKMDTIPNSNNIIENNNISGFGYGVVSFGIGPLLMSNEGIYKRFYNHSNKIAGNNINNVYRAGILLGYEENSEVSNNRIYNIGNQFTDAAGIIVGGNSRPDANGYNCVGVKISGNEISGISSSKIATGISVEQVRSTFQGLSGGQTYFPDVAESMLISNNAVWGLNPTNESAIQIGIHMFTRRTENFDPVTNLLTPYAPGYQTSGDKIINNTIIISNDGGISNVGPIAGIGIQQSSGSILMNNAIALLDNTISPDNPIASAVLYQGIMPKDNGLKSDRNAYWLGKSGGSLFRFIQTDASSKILEPGERNEFTTLGQWQLWTGGDPNSAVGNFTTDLTFLGTAPQKMRISTSPEPPLGSILNNRGDRTDLVKNDIDGNPRGAAGQRYDIGAFEFNGRMYVSDVETVSLPQPGAYMAGSGTFSDAEYIMTEAPCEVKARLRNNGSLQQSDINVRVKIYREMPGGQFSSSAEVDQTVKTSIPSTENIDVLFGLADGKGIDFMPKTYGDLRPAYIVPSQFASMEQNVTPRYKIEVALESDQQNENNIITKIVRYYLKRSSISMLVSAENSMTDIYFNGTPTSDQVAGRLNTDSLITALRNLGWYSDISEHRYNVDVFERLGWEPRSVNYMMYQTLLWSDGDDKPLSTYQRADLEKYLIDGKVGNKKNLVVCSQDIVRTHSHDDEYNDQDFIGTYLRSLNVRPENPLGEGADNNGNNIIGISIGRDITEPIKSTLFNGDQPPLCGLMAVNPQGDGLARAAFNYVNHLDGLESINMGVATSTLTRNVVNLGTDWRHFGDIEGMMRSIFDYLQKNDGIIPVELTNFDAKAVGKRVDLTWQTESEINSAVFEVERAQMNTSGRSQFLFIDRIPAAGKSAEPREYGPITDYKVDYGNTYIYRLKMVDNDGSFRYSSEKTATITAGGGIVLGEATPNPATDKVSFKLSRDAGVEPSFIIYDMNGKQVSASIEMADVKVNVDLQNLTAGIYTIVLTSGDVVISRQFTVIR